MVSPDKETLLEGAASCVPGPAGAEVSGQGPDLWRPLSLTYSLRLLGLLTPGWEETTRWRNRNQCCRRAGPSLLTSEPEDIVLVSCHLPEEQGWNWLGAAACGAVRPLTAQWGRAQGLGCARAKLRTRSLHGTVSSPGTRGLCPNWW